MIGLGSAIGAGLSAVGSIFGLRSASKAMKRVKADIESQQAKNQAWYDRRYNEDPTQLASAQAVLGRVEESIRNRNRQAAGMQAVTGGTEESVAAARAANGNALATAATNVAVNGEARRDAIESAYQQTDASLHGQLNDMERARAGQTAAAVKGVTDAAGEIAGIL